jgi:hypothetical protein
MQARNRSRPGGYREGAMCWIAQADHICPQTTIASYPNTNIKKLNCLD